MYKFEKDQDTLIIQDKIIVNTAFDGGSIEVISIEDVSNLQFQLRKDTNSQVNQWFYFQLNNILDEYLTINIINLQNSTFPKAWHNYNICMSYNNEDWFRVDTTFINNVLSCSIESECNSIYIAYFTPYTYSRHCNFIARSNEVRFIRHHILGQTIQGRPIDLLKLTIHDDELFPTNQKIYKIWLIARQHSGESMSSWFIEGFITRLFNLDDSLVRTLLETVEFYIVPNMNPDGTYLGNLRGNALGLDLNRAWLDAKPDTVPEVYYVKEKILELGADLFIDIHGDEELDYVFTFSGQTQNGVSAKQLKFMELLNKYLPLITPDYQTKEGYKIDHFDTEIHKLAPSWAANTLNCPSLCLEMPFKDNKFLPHIVTEWSAERSYLLGSNFVTLINFLLKHL